ncbi:uncharacterized protein [Diabrotica undecimpunctata]|uniref:uncharacterized protein n=1 Tax=Diabrotica undecimpunctata TaxID=50387 RepID=UPI003B63DAAB
MAGSYRKTIDAVFGNKKYLRPEVDIERLLECLENSDIDVSDSENSDDGFDPNEESYQPQQSDSAQHTDDEQDTEMPPEDELDNVSLSERKKKGEPKYMEKKWVFLSLSI